MSDKAHQGTPRPADDDLIVDDGGSAGASGPLTQRARRALEMAHAELRRDLERAALSRHILATLR
jgi:hypothetical protein